MKNTLNMNQQKNVFFLNFIQSFIVLLILSIFPQVAFAAAVDSTRYQSLDSILDQIFTRKKQEFVWRLNNEVPGSKKLFFTIDLDEEILAYIKWGKITLDGSFEMVDINRGNYPELDELEDSIFQFEKQYINSPTILIFNISTANRFPWLGIFDTLSNVQTTKDLVNAVEKSKKQEYNQKVIQLINVHVIEFYKFISQSINTYAGSVIVISTYTSKKVLMDSKREREIASTIMLREIKGYPSTDETLLRTINCITHQFDENKRSGRYKDKTFSTIYNYVTSTLQVLSVGYVCDTMENKTPLVANFNVPLENVSQELNDFADLFARKAERLYLARSNIENFEFNTGTIFHYGDIKDNFTIPGLIDRRIDDQLALLYQRDNVFYVVVSGYLDIILPTSQWNGFAQLVRSKLNRSIIADVSIVIVTIPAKFNRIYYGDFYDQMPGISFDESTIDGERLSAVFGSIKKSYQVITQGFKFCRKKVDTYILSRYANGTLDDIVVHRDKEAGVGIEANIEIVLRSNIYFDLINALEVPKRSIWVYSGQKKFGYSIPNENYFAELLSYELQKNDYLYQAEITSESPTSWKTIPVEENFVENSIPEIYFDYLNNLAFTDPISKWFFKLGIILEENPIYLNPITLGLSFIEFIRDDLPPDSITNIRSIRSSDTYDDMIFEVFDPIVYTTVNILGMIPAVDNIADCIGLAYATVRGNEDEIINYSIGMALVGVGTAGVKIIRESITPIKNAIVSARGATFIALANSAFLPVKARNSFRMIAFSTAMRIDPDQVIQLSENFYQAAINKAFHSHQIRIIYHAEEADKLTYLKLLDKEGTDIYAHVRRPELQQIQNVADNLLNAEKRVHLSDILKSMDNATLNQLEKDLTGEGGEALRALFGEKVGCVRAWEVAAKHNDEIRLDVEFLSRLNNHLDNYPKLDIDIDNPILFNAYKKINDNPELGFEILKELEEDVTDQIQALAKSEFFKHFVVKGRQFNKNIVDNFLSNNVIKNKLQQLFPGINLNEYQLLTEVQLYTTNGFTKADILLVKKTGNTIEDVIYIENKLSKSTTFTTRQKEGLSIIKNQGQLTVKTGGGNVLPSNNPIILPQGKCLKISDHGNTDISGLTGGDIELIKFSPF